MNLYGDRGNVQTLRKRCEWRGIGFSVAEINIGDRPDLTEFDLAFFGGGQDKEEFKISTDLIQTKAVELKSAVEDGLVMLTVCGGFQLLGEYYRPLHGEPLRGLSIMDLRTEGGTRRAIGNILIQIKSGSEEYKLVGFENHSGRTYLGPGCQPLGRLLRGFGNNGEDGWEGARYRNCFGTYLHGPLLPKNPHFADYLISLALERKYGRAELAPLDDFLETQTREYVIRRIQRRFIQ